MPALKHGHISPTATEDAQITRAALADPDALPYTDAQFANIQATVKRGRPFTEAPKKSTTIRFSDDVLTSFRRTGKGWQTRMDNALRDWLKTHSLS